jgi:excisionase family DNA binding protein
MTTEFNQDLKLYTTDELAKVFNISKPTVYRIIMSRKISFYKVKGSIRFSEEDVLKYLEENKIKSVD